MDRITWDKGYKGPVTEDDEETVSEVWCWRTGPTQLYDSDIKGQHVEWTHWGVTTSSPPCVFRSILVFSR